MSILIRRMEADDVNIVYDLERKSFSDPWTLPSFNYEVGNTQSSYPCVLLKNNKVAGYAVVWYYCGEIHIGNFAISPNYRKQGLGKILLEHILEKFKKYETAFLEVRISNEAAINLYKKFAFEELYIRENYYADNENAVVMWKNLKR